MAGARAGASAHQQALATGSIGLQGAQLAPTRTQVLSAAQPSVLSDFYLFGQFTVDTGKNVLSAAVGDFNKDGKTDIVVGHQGPNPTFSVILGKPDGTFGSALDYPTTGIDPNSGIAVGDFDGDGNLDVAVSVDTGISVSLGNGDGTFRSPVNYQSTARESLIVADFNGDGKLDLASTSFWGDVSILLGNGNGTFNGEIHYLVPGSSSWLTSGDFNGDGIPDLALDGSVLLGNGDGTFQAAKYYALPQGSIAEVLAAGDFNHDGKLDLAIADDGIKGVLVLLGNGDGSFQQATQYSIGTGTRNVLTYDFNGDGKLDLVAATATGTAVFLGNGDGTFQPVTFYAAAPFGTLAVLDANGDGIGDLVVSGQNANAVNILLGNADGTFNYKNYFSDSPLWVAAEDFNGDGHDDLVSANWLSNTVSVMVNNGDGTFQPHVDYAAGATPNCVAAADFNGDGKMDLAVSGGRFTIAILLGNGDGTFQSESEFAIPKAARMIAVDDFNNDGKKDLIGAIWYSNSVLAFLGNGDGTFQAGTEYAVGPGPVMVATADLNGDGKKDLIVANSGCVYSCDLSTSGISILLGNGDGTFQPKVDYVTGLGPTSIAVGDFNHDNHLDLMVANEGWGGSISVFLGNGDGTFQPRVDYPSPGPAWGVIADIDGDGNLDMVFSGNNAGAVALGNGDGTFQPSLATGNLGGPLITGHFQNANQLDLAGIGQTGITVMLNRPVASLFPTHFNFGKVAYGNASQASAFLVSNPGVVPLVLSSVDAVGDFGQTNTCTATLGAAGNCTIMASFSPTKFGTRTGGVLVRDNAPGGVQDLFLSGWGDPAIKFSNTVTNFGFVKIGQTGTRQIGITNRGGIDIAISKIAVTGLNRADFSQTNSCGTAILANSSCTITISFKPTKPGPKLAAVSINDTDVLSPRSVLLRGIAGAR